MHHAVIEISPQEGASGPLLLWRFGAPMRSITSASVGGGVTRPKWILNMTVDSEYSRVDPEIHVATVAKDLKLSGIGVGLLTAVDVRTRTMCSVEGASVVATVGVSKPIWAYDATRPLSSLGSPNQEPPKPAPPGTINLVCGVRQTLSDAALVNAISTITEAKTQALFDAGIAGTGTASDAICLVCPDLFNTQNNPGARAKAEEIFGGPLSYWGERLAAATYQAVTENLDRQHKLKSSRP